MTTSSSNLLTACELSHSLNSGSLSIEEVASDTRNRITQRESEIGAWAFLDWASVQQRLEEINTIPAKLRGPLWGVPIAVKDIFDTFDMPTTYGSTIYQNHKPVADAACVARLRAAGALLVGKTVSTEFAFWKQGKTRNPLNPAHTPGGSSSGSAASVADFMLPLALGSQTAASTIRPAAYCGIVGFKPTWGLISTAGVKALAGSMDTVGLLARNVQDVSMLFNVLIGARETDSRNPELPDTLRFRIWNDGELDFASAACLSHFENCQSFIKSLGAEIKQPPSKQSMSKQPLSNPHHPPLYSIQTDLMAYESSRELAFEYHFHNTKISDVLNAFLRDGLKLSDSDWHEAIKRRAEILAGLDDYFGDADFLIMPSAVDVAPRYEDGTGDPIMSRAWTLLGLPSISLPLVNDSSGLPHGMQLAARPGHDRLLLTVAQHLFSNSATAQSTLRPS